MPARTNLQLIAAAEHGLLQRPKAEQLESEVRDLIATLENVADALDAYACAERDEIADTRDTLASEASDALSDLRAFGFQL